MAGERPKWDGLLKWSLSHSEGTRTTRNLSEEDRKWFLEAMEGQTVNVLKRMKEITLVMKTPENILETQGVTAADIEGMLDELQEHVESIDMANDLHAIGGLVPLLGYLKNSHAGIRAKAAEVVTTVVQNNPRSQQLVMEANGLEPLMSNFSSDPDVTVRTKALGAISSLIRHNRLGLSAFRLASGYGALKDALGTDSIRFQRKALNLIQYLMQENKADCMVLSELGFPRMIMHLAASKSADVRESALGSLLELIKGGGMGIISGASAEEGEELKQILQQRIDGIITMAPDDLGAAREERQLVDLLWRACYNEPSLLQEKGLVVLAGEDEPAPDVAGKMFEPPLRRWVAKQISDEKNYDPNPLFLGYAPPTESHAENANNENDGAP
ncbi:hsp70 nucleotide exchange factor fes1-like isoform X1 [Nymphaea colorata]|nr:hsp70 nucleotide exchange factor fes1-like isoform X1 [Nymphaea colorata]XP_031484700.1 hsp70 nucleotide exchange factor fes1-like isoform X1 [Nymphaea colorata]XP_031484701.1 hsp70 nucleotide exchange factor fes1-like isoform X1 [Nymphaea colorata]XP_049933720.1 hsp70 nucleotide exchange factor fes1-like isoform X1 [Nymphaea colorata]